MQNLTHQRCFNHDTREAVARCPECRRFFCRECVTEHEDRALCAACLKKLARVPLLKRRAFAGALHIGQCLFSLFMAWFFFYLIGEGLLSLPDSFHEGTLWKVNWLDRE
jgi:uncharacterized paraquat-inducible protein A